MYYETFSLQFPVVEFGTGVEVQLFTTSISEFEFLIASMTWQPSETMHSSENVMNNLFSSLFLLFLMQKHYLHFL